MNVISTTSTNDCDGLFGGGSDFVWEYQATDNTVGNNNNNPEIPFTDWNFTHVNDNNGPYTQTVNETFFDHHYACPGQLPSNIIITWNAYENDDATNYGLLLTEGETGDQTINLPIPPIGGTGSISDNATGASSCTQGFTISFSIATFPTTGSIADNICDAPVILVDGGDYDYSWCGNQTFEPGEPFDNGKDIANHGSAWVVFTAPATGEVDISTDLGITDFGTEIYVYHAADGMGCNAGTNQCTGVQFKTKFDYLSFLDDADLGGLLNLEGEADISMTSCSAAFSGLTVGPTLIPGETYYIQVSTDNNNQSGVLGINVSSQGNDPGDAYDIPCGAIPVTITQTVQQQGVSPPTVPNINYECSFDFETDEDHLAAAYAFDETPTGDDPDESIWLSFVAPCSGAVHFEGEIPDILGIQGEAISLYEPDPALAPFLSGTQNCWDLHIPNYTENFDNAGFFSIGETALIEKTCLEPGYTYFGMMDPNTVSLGVFNVWLYDPGSMAPGNDVLCLALEDPAFEVPVQLLGAPTTPVVGGDNTNSCFEYLAGEPLSSAVGAAANQTNWHYFVAPPSGVVDITASAGSIGAINFAVYPLLNTNTCYGGLSGNTASCPSPAAIAGATYTSDGTPATCQIDALGSSVANTTGSTLQLCCLNPGQTYAIQVDGAGAGDIGSYLIDNISEVEVTAGNTSYTDTDGDTYDANSTAPNIGLICFGESITAASANAVLPSGGCLAEGFLLHDNTSITNPFTGTTIYESAPPNTTPEFINDGLPAGTPYNTIIYVSALADEAANWGNICPSARITDAAPVVFLEEIVFAAPTINPNTCETSISVSGGLPAYDASNFDFEVTGPIPSTDVITSGTTLANGGTIVFSPTLGGGASYLVSVTDDEGCTQTTTVVVPVACDPCLLYNPIALAPTPVVYVCDPATQTATVTLTLSGGKPETDGSNYIITVTGSTAGGNTSMTPFPGMMAGTVQYTFAVGDGDTWSISVTDEDNCTPATASETFVFNTTNCPDVCTMFPIVVSGYEYNCLGNGTAEVTVTMNGGLPSADGGATGYSVTITGSTGANGTFPVASVGGGATTYTFTVNDGDTWVASVTDDLGCPAATATDQFNEGTPDCISTCATLPAITINGFTGTEYDCNGDGTASVTVNVTGGIGPEYTMTLTINGTPTTSMSTGGGNFTLTVNDGDVWSLSATDALGCPPDQIGDTFEEGIPDCLESCNALPPITISGFTGTEYDCLGNGTASVTINVTGGFGPEYEVTVVINTVTQAPMMTTNNGDFTLVVNDGDDWTISVTDVVGCPGDAVGDLFEEGIPDCLEPCTMMPPISIAGFTGAEYDCMGDGIASVDINVTGGFGPEYDITLTINGNSSSGTTSNNGAYTFVVNDGDVWTLEATDAVGCPPDNIGDTFIQDPLEDCLITCNMLNPVIINDSQGYSYDCDGNGNGTVALTITGGLPEADMGATSYFLEVTINGNTSLIPSNGSYTISLMDGDVWSVVAMDDLGCTLDDLGGTNPITFNAVDANAGSNVSIYIGDQTTLNGSGGLNYEWDPTTGLSDPTISNPVANPEATTTYTLTVSDDQGCVDVDEVTVEVIDMLDCLETVLGFTPNGDGVNDFWVIECIQFFDNEVEVYNRWGQELYSATNYDNTWDGTYEGKPVPDGTYYFVVKMQEPNDVRVFKGTVTIIR